MSKIRELQQETPESKSKQSRFSFHKRNNSKIDHKFDRSTIKNFKNSKGSFISVSDSQLPSSENLSEINGNLPINVLSARNSIPLTRGKTFKMKLSLELDIKIETLQSIKNSHKSIQRISSQKSIKYTTSRKKIGLKTKI